MTINTRTMSHVALMTAVLAVIGPFSIPLPFSPVPISLQSFGVHLVAVILGAKFGTLSYGIYYLLALVGVPVLSQLRGGFSVLVGPTGGYLLGFFLVTLISGYAVNRWYKEKLKAQAVMILGTLLSNVIGTLWLMAQLKLGLKDALIAGFFPFILGDLLKTILAFHLGLLIRKAIKKTAY